MLHQLVKSSEKYRVLMVLFLVLCFNFFVADMFPKLTSWRKLCLETKSPEGALRLVVSVADLAECELQVPTDAISGSTGDHEVSWGQERESLVCLDSDIK